MLASTSTNHSTSMQLERCTKPRAGPGPSSARHMSLSLPGSSCRVQQPRPSRCSTSASSCTSQQPTLLCLDTPNPWHRSVAAGRTSGRAPVHLSQHQQSLTQHCRVACKAAGHSSYSSSSKSSSRPPGQPLCRSSRQQQQALPRSNILSSSQLRQGLRADPYPQPASLASRSVACAASLALADPITAATAAVASAAVTASSLSFDKIVAVVLGYAVMAGSLFRSVPQIAKVLQHSSTEGLSLTSYIVELCCYSVTIAYNINQGYGFNTFGEVCACWAQDIILIGLIFRFSKTRKWVAAATGIVVALGCVWLLSPTCPPQVLAMLQASNIVTMALGSRLPQIILNMRRGNAGVLSVTTCLLNVAGNAARVFTTIVLTGDMLILGGFFSQGTLNTVLLCQSIGTEKQRRRAAGSAPEPIAAPTKAAGPDAPAGGLIMQPAT